MILIANASSLIKAIYNIKLAVNMRSEMVFNMHVL